MKGTNFGLLPIAAGLAIAGFVFYSNSKISRLGRPFSAYGMLQSSWEKYQEAFVAPEGRVVDPSQGGETTSEGQSYAMLRAVLMDDKATFDKVWTWTKTNLKRPADNLMGWKWSKVAGGNNSASDAEEDIALALIMAGRRWHDESYTLEAQKIVSDLWKINTATIGGKRYMTAGNWANTNEELIINPSYFSPYAWREFAKIDNSHDWISLITPAYDLLEASAQNNLGTDGTVGLPPDWIAIDKANGKIKAPSETTFNTNYSYDAIRVPFRIGLDYIWNKEPRAYTYLQKAFGYLDKEYKANERLAAVYTHNGAVVEAQESPALYATTLVYFKIMDPGAAKQLFEEKIASLYSNDANAFNKDIPYYEQNWLWFGTAFYYGLIQKAEG